MTFGEWLTTPVPYFYGAGVVVILVAYKWPTIRLWWLRREHKRLVEKNHRLTKELERIRREQQEGRWYQ